jgi:hypothetical protein
MKAIFAACLIALALTCVPGQQAQAQARDHVISADPLGLAFGMLNATYEQKVGNSNSFTIFGSYWSYLSWTAYGFGGSYRWYFNLNDGKAPLEGLSAGPMISVGVWDWGGISFINDYSGGTSIAIGGELAYKWIFGQFAVEPILRLNFNVASISGLDYRAYGLGVNLGYAW